MIQTAENTTVVPKTSKEFLHEQTETINPDRLVELAEQSVRLLMSTIKQKFGLHSANFEASNFSQLSQKELKQLIERLPSFFGSSEKFVFGTNELTDSDRAMQEIIESGIIGSLSDIRLDKTRNAEDKLYDKRRAGTISKEDFAQLKQHFTNEHKSSLALVIHSNHVYRDLATEFDFDRADVRRIIFATSLKDKLQEGTHLEEGIAAEVAMKKGIEHIILESSEKNDGHKRSVSFGNIEDDKKGGDLVYTVDDKNYFIDAKAYNPDDQSIDPDRYGLTFESPTAVKDNFISKATIRFPNPEVIGSRYQVEGNKFLEKLRQATAELERR